MGFRYDIQGLRALAVLLVFIFHLNSSWLTGGFVGVDIFFVISGFLVSSIILHKKEKGTFGFADFYIGRIKRIVPTYVIVLFVIIFLGSYIYIPVDIKTLRLGEVHALFFNSNNYLASLDNYFGASSQENPLLHTWTLSIEMQFYFLLPLFLILIKKNYIVPVSFFIIVILFGYSFYNSTFLNNQSAMYFSLIARIPEFLIGTIFAVKAKEIKKLIGNKQDVVALASLIGIIVCGALYTENINFPGLWVILPCVFAGTILVTTESKVNALFSNKVLVHIGELSYSIYLWHWVIMSFVRYYFVRIDFTWYEMFTIIILTYVLSWLSFTYIENVFREKYTKIKIVMSFVFFSGFGLYAMWLPKINEQNMKIPKEYGIPFFGINTHGGKFEQIGNFGSLSDSVDSQKIALIGDSHAFAYLGFFDEVGKANGFSFHTITNSTYPLISELDSKEFLSNDLYENYLLLQEITDSLIIKSDIVFVAFNWNNSLKYLDKSIEDFVKKNHQSKKIIFVQDFPILDKNELRINRGYLKNNSYKKSDVFVPEVPEIVKRVVTEYKNVYLLELDYSLLLEELPYHNDTLMYYDKGHLNYYGSTLLKRFYDQELLEYIKIKN